jgi:cobalt-zinc-cadmium efflux system outer membrane protein
VPVYLAQLTLLTPFLHNSYNPKPAKPIVEGREDEWIMRNHTRRLFLWSILLAASAWSTLHGPCDRSTCVRAQEAVDADKPIAEQKEELKPPPRGLAERLKMPGDLPGADAKPIPKEVSSRDKAEREAAVDRLYPKLPPLVLPPQPLAGPTGQPLSLNELQQMALDHSPLIRQAQADVESARGTAIQAGLWPNPTVGYQSAQVKPDVNSGQQGWFIEQIIKTAHKPGLARAAALMDLRNAEVALRKAQVDLLSQVRGGYFAVLVAQASVRVNAALARFTEEVHRIQVEQLKGGEAAAYEPMQLRVLALQARTNLVQAHNRSIAAWKQLVATLGVPGLPPTELAGKVEMPIPQYAYDSALARVLTGHTDVITAENTQLKARYSLRLAKATPIPDIDAQGVFQFDNADSHHQYGLQFGIALPILDRNQGNIMAAEGALQRALEESHRVRDDLTSRVADAFERYENNRIILDYYRTNILPDQVRAYRGVYERHGVEPDKVGFGDVVNAQQTLATTITAYLGALDAQWKAVVDLAALLQVDDLFESAQMDCVAPIPDLEHLPPLPCCHPCSPLSGAAVNSADGQWPPAVVPADKSLPMPKPASPEPEEKAGKEN